MSLDFKTKLAHYAELLVVHGMNVQSGQPVFLAGEVPHRELLLLIAECAYDRGAKTVSVDLLDERFSRMRIDKTKQDDWLEYIPSYLSKKSEELVDEGAASVRLVGSEFPEVMEGVDATRANIVRKAIYQARKYFYDEGIDKNRVHWTVAAGATESWAARVYPELNPIDALEHLWNDLFAFCRVGEGDHLLQWRKLDEQLHKRAAKLNEASFSSIRFVGEGTDLTVGLSERARFHGGTSESSRGVRFEPNMPTEECFTTPDWRSCSGQVRATRPFYVNRALISDLQFTIKDGEITTFSCSTGEDTFRAYINSDPGAKRLGEVALVDCSSPIFQRGKVYEDTLLDENAACHIAVGSGYRFCLEMNPECEESEWEAIGCNSSSVHTDIMISDEKTSVIGYQQDGSEVPIIADGHWVNDF